MNDFQNAIDECELIYCASKGDNVTRSKNIGHERVLKRLNMGFMNEDGNNVIIIFNNNNLYGLHINILIIHFIQIN